MNCNSKLRSKGSALIESEFVLGSNPTKAAATVTNNGHLGYCD